MSACLFVPHCDQTWSSWLVSCLIAFSVNSQSLCHQSCQIVTLSIVNPDVVSRVTRRELCQLSILMSSVVSHARTRSWSIQTHMLLSVYKTQKGGAWWQYTFFVQNVRSLGFWIVYKLFYREVCLLSKYTTFKIISTVFRFVLDNRAQCWFYSNA